MKATFVRYGALKPMKQKNNFGVECFHNAPAKRGFYCFPLKLQEMFLIGCLSQTQPQFFSKEERTHGGLTKARMRSLRHEFTVDGKHEVWHHLVDYCQQGEIIARHGENWVKTTVLEWEKAVQRVMAADFAKAGKPNKSFYSKDGYEVFFENI